MTTATSLSADARPAFVEFSLLESWLASASALQLPLHLIESQQQAKGREVQRLLLQAHLLHRGNGDVGPALQLEQADGLVLYSHRRLSTRSLRVPVTKGCGFSTPQYSLRKQMQATRCG